MVGVALIGNPWLGAVVSISVLHPTAEHSLVDCANVFLAETDLLRDQWARDAANDHFADGLGFCLE
jgi:hypothetical protein